MNSSRRRVVIMGAAGRDFHNFLQVFRDDPGVEVVAFTAAQIPGIAGRRFPASLAGDAYPGGIPIVDEQFLEQLVSEHDVDEVVFSYSDISHLAGDAPGLARARQRRQLRAARPGAHHAARAVPGDRGLRGAHRVRQVAGGALAGAASARGGTEKRRDPPSDALRRPRGPARAALRRARRPRARALHHRGARGIRAAHRARRDGVRRRRLRRGAGRGRARCAGDRLGRRQQRLPLRAPGPAHRAARPDARRP